MRRLELLMNSSVCRQAHALTGTSVSTLAELNDTGEKKCPLYDRCHEGGMLGWGRLQCIPGHAHDVAINAAMGSGIDEEIEDIAKADIFPPKVLGFIDPYSDPAALVFSKEEILERIRGWAHALLYGVNGNGNGSGEAPPD